MINVTNCHFDTNSWPKLGKRECKIKFFLQTFCQFSVSLLFLYSKLMLGITYSKWHASSKSSQDPKIVFILDTHCDFTCTFPIPPIMVQKIKSAFKQNFATNCRSRWLTFFNQLVYCMPCSSVVHCKYLQGVTGKVYCSSSWRLAVESRDLYPAEKK